MTIESNVGLERIDLEFFRPTISAGHSAFGRRSWARPISRQLERARPQSRSVDDRLFTVANHPGTA
jgi:hypothetical protein